MYTKAEREADKARYLDYLQEHLKPGATVYTILRHVSRSGMQRSISLQIITDGEINDITGRAAAVMGSRRDDKRGGIKVGGCGMDMGFHLVYNLSRTLYPNGWICVGKDCRENHWARDYHEDGTKTERKVPKGKKTRHADGGYALKHRWL